MFCVYSVVIKNAKGGGNLKAEPEAQAHAQSNARNHMWREGGGTSLGLVNKTRHRNMCAHSTITLHTKKKKRKWSNNNKGGLGADALSASLLPLLAFATDGLVKVYKKKGGGE